MEIDKDKLTEKASQISGQAKELMSKVDTGKAMRITDQFMALMFKFGKILAALFIILFIIVFAGSLVYYVFSGASSVKVPEFEDIKPMLELGEKSSGDSSGVSNALYKELRNDYGSKVDDLIEIGGLDAKNDYTRIINQLGNLDEDLRSPYIKGAIAFLKDYKEYIKTKKDKQFDGNDALGGYRDMFRSAISEAEGNKKIAAEKRSVALRICGQSLVGLILFLFIPLLIQIEENTRK